MKFHADKSSLLKLLQRIQGVVEKRNTKPILANVYIEAADGRIVTMATDLEIFIKDACEGAVMEEGAVTVNAKKLFDIVKELPEGDIDFSTDGERLTVKGSKAIFHLPGIAASEFPAFPAIDESTLRRVDPETLDTMIIHTAFAVSTDETRYNINGFLMEREDSRIRFVTTDGHRLAVVEGEAEGMEGDASEGVILPRKGVAELKRLLEEKEEPLLFGLSEKSAVARQGDTYVYIRLIDGDFPDYRQVIPRDNDKKAVAERSELLAALRRVSILSTDKIKGVRFNFSKQKLTLSFASPDVGDATEELDIRYDDEELEAAFNARYFIDVLEVLDDEEVMLELKDNASPVKLLPVGRDDYTYIVMPMRL
ncbi:MAG TPA: DNA polymerase III subunit beta [Deltaproteobacteria bacterium]|nr:DNA polymerase III subunit beta [Deltaproteobacteria bacterium]